jgi:hypothetical protein
MKFCGRFTALNTTHPLDKTTNVDDLKIHLFLLFQLSSIAHHSLNI